MMKKILPFILFILAAAFVNLHASEVQTVAVIPFDDNVISQSEAIALSDILENRLAQFGNFNLVERKKIEDLMKELSFGTSDFIDQETAVEAGRMLSAHWLILGSVSKLGKLYSVNVKLVNTESGRIVTGADGDAKDIIGIKKRVEDIAKTLSKHLLTDFIHALEVFGSAMLYFPQGLPEGFSQEDISFQSLHSFGGSVGYLHKVTNLISLGVWGSGYIKGRDRELGYQYGGKVVVGDPRDIAISASVSMNQMIMLGMYFKNTIIEVSPPLLIGIDNAFLVSVGYSVGL